MKNYHKEHRCENCKTVIGDRNTLIGDYIVLSSDERSLNMFKDEAYEFASDMVAENETPKVEIYKLVAIVEVEKPRIKITEV